MEDALEFIRRQNLRSTREADLKRPSQDETVTGMPPPKKRKSDIEAVSASTPIIATPNDTASLESVLQNLEMFIRVEGLSDEVSLARLLYLHDG